MSKDKLNSLRNKIDKIDQQLVRLLDERAELAGKIGQSKSEGGLAIFDAARQKEVLKKVLKLTQGQFPREGLKSVFTEIMSACLTLEQPVKVGYLGPKATFTHLAAITEFGSSSRQLPYKTIEDIFLAAENGWVDYGVVPIENTTGGIVHLTLDMFLKYDLKICSELIVYIRQNLLSRYPLEQIKKVYSSAQPFSQCHIWIKENLPGVELKEVSTTAQGVMLARRVKNSAAIASELAARLYGLNIVSRGIEDLKDNFTRFLVIGKEFPAPSGDDKTSIMFSLKDRPGALHNALKPFAQAGINLSKIESRPTRRRAWEYVFFVDLDGHINQPKIKKALDAVERISVFVKVLGSYPKGIVVK